MCMMCGEKISDECKRRLTIEVEETIMKMREMGCFKGEGHNNYIQYLRRSHNHHASISA